MLVFDLLRPFLSTLRAAPLFQKQDCCNPLIRVPNARSQISETSESFNQFFQPQPTSNQHLDVRHRLSLSIPMPSCFCTHARCNGAIIGQKAFENHQRHDKQQRACEALSAANQVCQDEDEQIAAYIASLTLSDDATGDLTGSGGRLWSRSSSSTLPSSTPSLSTPHMPVSKALDQLHDIERALEDLHSTVEPRLNTLEKPSSRADLFPLKAELSQSLALQNRLSAITSKVPSVRETKGPIHGRLLAFLSKLRDAQTEWNKHLKLLPEETSTFPTFDTGQLLLDFLLSTVLKVL